MRTPRGGSIPRAAKVSRSGSRSSSNSISRRGLRLRWPPSGRIWWSSSSESANSSRRRRPSWPSRQIAAKATAIRHCSRAAALDGAGESEVQPVGEPRDMAHEALVEDVIGAFEQQRRMRQEGDQPPRRDGRPTGDLVAVALPGDEVIDQRAGIGAGDRGVGRAHVAQPAEAVQRLGPGLARRLAVEGRFAMGAQRAAGKGVVAGIDVAGGGRVGGAQVMRGEEQARRAWRGRRARACARRRRTGHGSAGPPVRSRPAPSPLRSDHPFNAPIRPVPITPGAVRQCESPHRHSLIRRLA